MGEAGGSFEMAQCFRTGRKGKAPKATPEQPDESGTGRRKEYPVDARRDAAEKAEQGKRHIKPCKGRCGPERGHEGFDEQEKAGRPHAPLDAQGQARCSFLLTPVGCTVADFFVWAGQCLSPRSALLPAADFPRPIKPA